MSDFIQTPLGKKRMSFIVHCLETHDALVCAIQEAISDLLEGECDDGSHPIVSQVIEDLKETLKGVCG
jgi:hypothetical protein